MADDTKKTDEKAGAEVTKKATVELAKAYGGPLGKGIELASKTKLGNAYLNKSAEVFNKKNPGIGKLATAIGKGNQDLINKNKNNNTDNGANESQGTKQTSGLNKGAKSGSKTGFGGSKESSSGEASGQGDFDFAAYLGKLAKKHWQKIVAVIAGALLFLILFIAIYMVIAAVAGGVVNFFNKVGNTLVGFFDKKAEEAANRYYKKLEEVQDDRQTEKNVCIDVNLLTATLTVDLDASEFTTHEEEAMSDEADEEEGLTAADYNRMTKEVELLANMQIKTKTYGNDTSLNYAGGMCKKENSGTDTEKVNAQNEDRLKLSLAKKIRAANTNGRDSSTPNLVSQHDVEGFAKFFTKKVNEETNYEYYLYQPEAVLECPNPGYDEHNCPSSLVPNCHDAVPEDSYELSIGDLSTMKDSVYYWNLVNSFIPNYYDRYLPKEEGAERDEAIRKIAERIYLLYADVGPSTSCMSAQEFICRSDEGDGYFSGQNGEVKIPAAANQSEFFNKISNIAINEMSRTGIAASVTMAQAALESSWGASGLSSRYANYYGMTAGSCASGSPAQNKGKILRPGEEGNNCTGNSYWNGTIVAMCNKKGQDCQWYRVYDSFENSTKDHSRLLTSGRYSDCNSYNNANKQIQCIKGHGYAEDSNYVSKVMGVINKHGLSQYDIGEWNGASIVDPTEPSYEDNLCVYMGNESFEVGDWRNWKQYNSPWGSQKITYQTIGKVGCAATSVAILLAKSGTHTRLGASLNPGTFVKEHKMHGGFAGDNIMWDVTDVAPNFRLVGRYNGNITPAGVKSLVDRGLYVILNVKYGAHFVAVDYVSGGVIHIVDPGYTKTVIPSDYDVRSIVGYVVYRKVD